MPRGGYRLGAGRKSTGSVTKSKVVRISEQNVPYVDNIENLLQLIKDWEIAAAASPTSPRWAKARQLLQEVRQVLEK